MNKVIPITNEQLIRFTKNFYKIDDISFCYVEDTYIDWYFYNTMELNDCEFYFLDTDVNNELINFDQLKQLRFLVSKILGIKT